MGDGEAVGVGVDVGDGEAVGDGVDVGDGDDSFLVNATPKVKGPFKS